MINNTNHQSNVVRQLSASKLRVLKFKGETLASLARLCVLAQNESVLDQGIDLLASTLCVETVVHSEPDESVLSDDKDSGEEKGEVIEHD